MRSTTLRSLSILTTLIASPSALAQVSVQPDCLGSISDAAAPGNCINASTLPTAGMLLPLGPELFVQPTGEVGINTMAPAHTLDVAGDLRVTDRLAIGNDATMVPIQNQFGDWDKLWDLSATVTDFSSARLWSPFRSNLKFAPTLHLTGADERFLEGHVFQSATEGDKDVHFLQGIQQNTSHWGTGTLEVMGGIFTGALNGFGHVDYMAAVSGSSITRYDATTLWNAAGEFWSGHWDEGYTGFITNNHGLYVYTPNTGGELTNHYGLFLEDQDVGAQDSYAIYSEGGTSYHEGNLGLGTDTPTVKLDVVGDFAATGTKSFVQEHPVDPTKEIRFVCLEGNEAGTYFRGDAHIRNGEAVLSVPEEFRLVSEEDGLTVQTTPLGERAVLWVTERSLDRIVVRGDADVEFCYFVNGVRKGYADFEVIRERAVRASNASRPERPDVRAIRGELALRSGDAR